MRQVLEASIVEPAVGANTVALAVADFLVRTERERQRLFRMHLQATLRRIPTLLLELAEMERVPLRQATALMHAPADWPWRPLPDPPSPFIRQHQQRRLMLNRETLKGRGLFRRAFATPGVLLRDVDHPRGRFAIRPAGDCVEFMARIGPCMLSVAGSTAMLRLPVPLPETLMTVMPGRRVGALVDHPLFQGGRHVVSRVITEASDDLPVLMFRTDLVPFTMRFAEDAE